MIVQQIELKGRVARLYLRVSSAGQEDGASLDDQERVGRLLCKREGLRVAAVYREASSASTYAYRERPEYRKLLADTRPGEVHVFYNDHRHYRDPTELERYRAYCTAMNVVGLYSNGAEPILPDLSSNTLFVKRVQAASNAKFSDDLSENIRRGHRGRALAQQRWPYQTKIGYRSVRNDRGKRVAVEPDPVAGPVVTRLFELAARGDHSLAMLTSWARQQGLRTMRKGKQLVCESSVLRILEDPYYRGEFEFKGEMVQSKDPTLIDAHTWFQARKAIKDKPGRGRSLGAESRIGLAYIGMMECARSGYAITGFLAKRTYPYYGCTRSCDCPSRPLVKPETIERLVAKELELLALSDGRAELLMAMVDGLEEREGDWRERQQKAARQRLDRARAGLDKLTQGWRDGLVLDDEYRRDRDRLREEEAAAHAVLDARAVDLSKHREALHLSIDLARGAWWALPRAPRELRKPLILHFASTVRLDRHAPAVELEWRKPFRRWVRYQTPEERLLVRENTDRALSELLDPSGGVSNPDPSREPAPRKKPAPQEGGGLRCVVAGPSLQNAAVDGISMPVGLLPVVEMIRAEGLGIRV